MLAAYVVDQQHFLWSIIAHVACRCEILITESGVTNFVIFSHALGNDWQFLQPMESKSRSCVLGTVFLNF
jgi:hypothetical protein